MGEMRRSGRDNAPDTALLVPIRNKGARGTRKLQVGAVEGSWRDVVEAIVIDPGQAIGAIRIGPDPALEGVLDLLQLCFRGLGVDDIEHAPLAPLLLDGVEDLRDPAVERVGEQLAGVPAVGASSAIQGGGNSS